MNSLNTYIEFDVTFIVSIIMNLGRVILIDFVDLVIFFGSSLKIYRITGTSLVDGFNDIVQYRYNIRSKNSGYLFFGIFRNLNLTLVQ